MLYLLGGTVNACDLLEFDQDTSTDPRAFRQGVPLKGDVVALAYTVKNRRALSRLRRSHYLESAGPDLVSAALRAALGTQERRGEVEFFEVGITCEGEPVDGFFAMNVTQRVPCTDLTASEFSITNFDASRPCYDFDYQVLRSAFDADVRVAICDEMPLRVVVDDEILTQVQAAALRGLTFCSAHDMTPEDRSVCVRL